MTSTNGKAIALFSKDGKAWADGSPVSWEPDHAVTKLVIGVLRSGNEQHAGVNVELADSVADVYPNLTHLHLWNVGNLKVLPVLPAGLKCLDLRDCRQLHRLSDLPGTLDTLVLERCPHLVAPRQTKFERLEDLSTKGSGGIGEGWLNAVLGSSPALRYLDVSECHWLKRIPKWVATLVDIRLDGCTHLTVLPATWPAQLRRIGLRGAEALGRIPDFPDTVDYVDLAGTRALRVLPKRRGHPRTLFLHGSGVLMPPASEHGASADENVAEATVSYFAEVALTGEGDVKRCKLLLLGNGGAGKTCLSLLLTGRNPGDAERLGSTHGVQFWDWGGFEANVDRSMEPVKVHLWDFGGQEIYHNTHRLFVSTGTVFVVLWHPDQDGRHPPTPDDGEYVDEWRPLQYWLDFIDLACPDRPRVAVVCSHHATRTGELENWWEQQVREEHRKVCPCFFVDSLGAADAKGETNELITWLQDAVGDVVNTQGRAVPTYWEIAQDMVDAWTSDSQANPNSAHGHQMTQADFAVHLNAAIARTVQDDSGDRCSRLRLAINEKTFELNSERIGRTLRFLTHSGWLYWDERLFEGRVIIGQQWALDGLYAILDRRKGSVVFRELAATGGRFTVSDLARMAWAGMGYSTAEQQLLVSYMERCNLCFRLRPAEEAWRDEAVYVSFEHLPPVENTPLEPDCRDRSGDGVSDTLSSPRLHKLHWQQLLVSAGSTFGPGATYAKDGLSVINTANQHVLLLFKPKREGLGGDITIEVKGPDAAARLEETRNDVRRFLPESDATPADSRLALGDTVAPVEVFVSYAWNRRSTDDYEEPVDRIVASLGPADVQARGSAGFDERTGLALVRDRDFMKTGDSIVTFMNYGARCPFVIIVHSDKYWTSPDCMYELMEIDRQLRDQHGKSRKLNVIPVAHPSSRIEWTKARREYVKHWKRVDDLPARIPDPDLLLDGVRGTIRQWAKDLSSDAGYNIQWPANPEEQEEALSQVRTRLLPDLPQPSRPSAS